MPPNPSQGLGKAESKLFRAAKALPFVGITAVAAKIMYGTALPPMVIRIGEIFENGVYDNVSNKGFIRPLQTFFGIDFIDSRITGLAGSFASFQFVDVICNWQAYSFLMDLGIVYAILLIESARRANYLTAAYFTVILGYNMQFLSIGVLMGLYCFAHYIQSPVENLCARDMRLTDMSYTATVLPVIILAHYIPNFFAFSTWIEPELRHKWEWIWQPFPIYVSFLQFALKKTVMPDTVEQDKLDKTERDIPTIKFTILALCAYSAAIWQYTVFFAPFSLVTHFVPNIAAAQTGDDYIRLFLQLDQSFSMGACFLWLLYLIGDMKKAGMVESSWISIIGRGLAIFAFAGPGVTVGLGWLWREGVLATKGHKDAIVAEKKSR
ncbi:hypothetical protein ACN47E_001752 [Coniothyrium glycines]